jgi:hypothetical protein
MVLLLYLSELSIIPIHRLVLLFYPADAGIYQCKCNNAKESKNHKILIQRKTINSMTCLPKVSY